MSRERRLLLCSIIAALSAPLPATGQAEILGGPLAGLTPQETAAFERGRAEFERLRSKQEGVGPYFGSQSCLGCHFRNATGGSGSNYTSNFVFGRQNGIEETVGGITRPWVDLLRFSGGPVLRQFSLADVEPQAVPAEANVFSLRKTPRLFGLGLVEAIPIRELERIAAGNGGRLPRDEEAWPLRFGSQSQLGTIRAFVEHALEVEIGVTPDERSDAEVGYLVDFLRLLAPPSRGEITEDAIAGEALFHAIGCGSCHVGSFSSGNRAYVTADGVFVNVGALQNRSFAPYSDFLLHRMGAELNDGIGLGHAHAEEYRTPPLWGYRLRIGDFLHDGRAANLHQTLIFHGGEAAEARRAYLELDTDERRLLSSFLRSL